MACAGAPESLAEVLELETDSPVDFAMVVRMVWVMQVKQLKHPEIIEMPGRMVKFDAHKLASGRIVKVMGGTQIIDRFWRHLRAYSVGRSAPVGSKALRVRVRSAQWAYWHRGQDLWLETGRMLQRLA